MPPQRMSRRSSPGLRFLGGASRGRSAARTLRSAFSSVKLRVGFTSSFAVGLHCGFRALGLEADATFVWILGLPNVELQRAHSSPCPVERGRWVGAAKPLPQWTQSPGSCGSSSKRHSGVSSSSGGMAKSFGPYPMGSLIRPPLVRWRGSDSWRAGRLRSCILDRPGIGRRPACEPAASLLLR